MKFGNQTHWDANNETIDQWLEREHKASERVENPCCPYCDHIVFDWWEFSLLGREYEIQDYAIDCGNCGKMYLVSKETRVRFESKPKTKEAEES